MIEAARKAWSRQGGRITPSASLVPLEEVLREMEVPTPSPLTIAEYLWRNERAKSEAAAAEESRDRRPPSLVEGPGPCLPTRPAGPSCGLIEPGIHRTG